TPAPEDADSAISAVSADLTSYKQTQATKEQATAQQINGLTTRLSNTESVISRVEKAVSDNQSATATQLNQLNSKMNNAESGISSLQTAISQANQSIAQTSQSLNAKIDGLSVGGRNYVRNSEREIVVTAPNQRYIRVSTGLDSIEEPFVVSAFVKDVGGNNGNKLTVIMADPANANNNEQSQDCEIINGRIIAKFNTLSNPHYTQILLYANSGAYRGSSTGTVTYYNIKLELGTVATDWTPAPEDADSAISAVSADLTSYKQTQATKEQATAQQINGLT
ncbi:hypothetical protein OQ257_11745, partial [Actinobacillus equuli subsp. equuli]|nr:hypothetical protein [Actinobacillus equuli subsp. equuli]